MAHQDLFRDFEPQTKQQWLDQITKDLKGGDFEKLLSTTSDGIIISPAYTSDDISDISQPFRENQNWDTVQEILVMDAVQANKQALDHLNRGTTSLLFYVQGNEDLELLLKDIGIQHIRLNLVVENNASDVASKLNDIIQKQEIPTEECHGSINHDPLENLARTGNWFISEEDDFEELKKINRDKPEYYSGLCLNVNLFANAGATPVQQLGIALSMAYETHHRVGSSDLNNFWVNFAAGSDYFGEIAKLRAFRRLWEQLNAELNYPSSQPHIYCESSMRNKSIKDAYNNMIRTTSEAMAAVIGGANEVLVKGFNHTFEEPTSFGERISKNQSSILQFESHLEAVKDMAQGSYFIENLTEEMATKGWEFFKEIENAGGYVESLKNGWLQGRIEESAVREQVAFDNGDLVLIGVNKYSRDENLKEIIKHGMFHRQNSSSTIVKPIVAKRLSEKLES